MTKTYTRKYKWGTLGIRADFQCDRDQVRYAVDEGITDGVWRNSPLTVGNVRSNVAEALSAINRWLKSEGR